MHTATLCLPPAQLERTKHESAPCPMVPTVNNEIKAAIQLIREAYLDFAVKLPKYPVPECGKEQDILEWAIQNAEDRTGGMS